MTNPFERGPHFNLTAQARIAREDPERAERLKSAAKTAEAAWKALLSDSATAWRCLITAHPRLRAKLEALRREAESL